MSLKKIDVLSSQAIQLCAERDQWREIAEDLAKELAYIYDSEQRFTATGKNLLEKFERAKNK